MPSYSAKYIGLFLLLSAFLAFGCSQTNTIVIDQDPDTTRSDTTEERDYREEGDDFQQLVIGELNPIASFDPLFAENGSTMRTLQLIYEGLVRYNREGDIQPAMAENWDVSEDSTEYTFELKNDIYYHDNNAFSNGVGRRMVADDVRQVFERMAELTVPDDAAQLFMNIRGFEPYFRERQEIKNPDQHTLETISGIQTPDEATIRFSLDEPDPHFLEKLANPYALIYPNEAVQTGSPSSFEPIGTGPFTISEIEESTQITLSQFEDYYDQQDIELNRIDVVVQTRESDLFRDFARGDIHLLPELGPQMAEGVVAENGDLQSNYEDNFELLINPGEHHLLLNHHIESDLNEEQRSLITSQIDSSFFPVQTEDKLYRFSRHAADSLHTDETALPDTMRVTHSDNPYAKWINSKMNDKLSNLDAALGVQPIRVPTADTDLFYTHHHRFYDAQQLAIPGNTLLAFNLPHLTLLANSVDNVAFNKYSWWIDLRSTSISD